MMTRGAWVLITVAAALSIAAGSIIFLAADNFNPQGENTPSSNDTGKQTVQNHVINVTDSVSIEHK
jgi:hypothetical protein